MQSLTSHKFIIVVNIVIKMSLKIVFKTQQVHVVKMLVNKVELWEFLTVFLC